MIVIEYGLFQYLSLHPLVSAIVGSGQTARIHAATVPTNLIRPKLTYQSIGAVRLSSNDGPTGHCVVRVQFNCIADDYATAGKLAKAVRMALDGYRGPAGDVVITQASIVDEADLPTAADAGKSVPIQVRRVDAKNKLERISSRLIDRADFRRFMAETNATVGYNSQLFVAPITGTTIGTYTKIAQTRDISTPEEEIGDIDVTNNDSPDNTKEYRPGMIDPGSIDFEAVYESTQWLAICDMFGDGAVYAWKEVLADGMTALFKGWVSKRSIDTKTDNEADTTKFTVRTTGKTGYAAAA